jgi:hypothetical protein
VSTRPSPACALLLHCHLACCFTRLVPLAVPCACRSPLLPQCCVQLCNLGLVRAVTAARYSVEAQALSAADVRAGRRIEQPARLRAVQPDGAREYPALPAAVRGAGAGGRGEPLGWCALQAARAGARGKRAAGQWRVGGCGKRGGAGGSIISHGAGCRRHTHVRAGAARMGPCSKRWGCADRQPGWLIRPGRAAIQAARPIRAVQLRWAARAPARRAAPRPPGRPAVRRSPGARADAARLRVSANPNRCP